MPPRPAVDKLPAEIRDELTAILVGNGFSDYAGGSEWLATKGYVIKKSALHRFGADLEAEFETSMQEARRSIALARAMRDSGKADDDGVLLDAASSVLQDQLLRISLALRTVEVDPAEAVKLVSQASRALADLGRMTVTNKKWQTEMAATIRAEERAKAAEAATTAAKAGGASPETIAVIREALGISA